MVLPLVSNLSLTTHEYDLCASTCNSHFGAVLYFALHTQAMSRAHRIGQKETVNIYR
jgi:hypothetical protein